MMRVWADGNFKGNYSKFHKSIVKRMSDIPMQTPEHFVIGPKNRSFDAQKPFTI
jgi:metacaspase-1